MSEEKLGQHYLAALNEAFPGVVLDHAWQTKDQLTVTVKVNYLPEVVEFLYYKQGLLRAVDGEGHQVLGDGSRRS